jgi:hypothetical protein
MKRLLFTLFLLGCAGPLFANDDGADPGYIPDYQELVREGYGPHTTTTTTQVEYSNPSFLETVPKPTQAYYGRGYTIYYGFTAVPVWQRNEFNTYAFGYPLAYFKSLMPQGVDSTNLSRYAMRVPTNSFEPGTYVAQRPIAHPAAVTTVQSVTTTPTTATPATGNATLPAIGEKPAH